MDLELELDFSEEDVEFASRDRLMALLTDLQTEVAQLLETFVLGQALKEGVPTALLGAPNAGKSTLLNALLREERALVSAVPGTTRDTVEERFTAGGILFRLVDTAGIRETDETVERLGIERSQEAARRAAVQVLVVDAVVWNADPLPTQNLWAQLEAWNPQGHRVLVFNKADQEQPISTPEGALVLSAATGAGANAWVVMTGWKSPPRLRVILKPSCSRENSERSFLRIRAISSLISLRSKLGASG